MKKVIIIGAGNIGSRHLQALKAVKIPLEIFVIDPSRVSLETARSRYESMPAGKFNHVMTFMPGFAKEIGSVDLAIVATRSDIRASITSDLLNKVKTRYLLLEKILFTKKEDYKKIGQLIKKTGTKTWVNCASREMDFYRKMQPEFRGSAFSYIVAGSNFGLVTNAVHYLDHIAHLSGCDDFILDTSGLDRKIIHSKRNGFLEVTGTLKATFKNGSCALLSSFSKGDAPIIVEFQNHKVRCISKESENMAWVSRANNGWRWQEVEAPITHQSQRTTRLAEQIFKNGTCSLIDYEGSSRIHLQMLEPLLKFVNENSRIKYDHYPFT